MESPSSLYTEACHAARHYSEAVRNIRVLATAQGLILLSAAGYLIQKGAIREVIAVSAFGLLFTLALLAVHAMYLEYAIATIEHAAKLEPGRGGAWSRVVDARSRRAGWRRWVYLHSPFVLLLLSFLAAPMLKTVM